MLRTIQPASLDEESGELKVSAQDCYITFLTTNPTTQTRWIQTQSIWVLSDKQPYGGVSDIYSITFKDYLW